jgi:hypothetical protein
VSIKVFKARALSNIRPTFVESRFGKHSSITVGCGLAAEKDVGIFHVDGLAGMFCDGSWALSEFAARFRTKKGRCINSGQNKTWTRSFKINVGLPGIKNAYTVQSGF